MALTLTNPDLISNPDSPGGSRKRSRKKQTRTVPCPEMGCSRMCRSQAELAIHRNSHTKVSGETIRDGGSWPSGRVPDFRFELSTLNVQAPDIDR